MVDNSFVKDFIHKVRPPDSSPLPLGREAARFFGSCQVLQRKKCKKRMPQVNWSTLLKHLNCQAGKVTGIALGLPDLFLTECDEFFRRFLIPGDSVRIEHNRLHAILSGNGF